MGGGSVDIYNAKHTDSVHFGAWLLRRSPRAEAKSFMLRLREASGRSWPLCDMFGRRLVAMARHIARGLYRVGEWAFVSYDVKEEIPIPRRNYDLANYLPVFADLSILSWPTFEEDDADDPAAIDDDKIEQEQRIG